MEKMKKRLREVLAGRRRDDIADMAAQKKRTLGVLVSLTFDPDPLIAWRAAEAMGAAADRVAEFNAEYVRSHVRRLFWLLNEESGGVCWYAPQAIAEIICRRPQLLADNIPILVTLITSMAAEDLTRFRAGVLWAIGRVAPVAGEHLETVLPAVVASLDEEAPQDRGMAVWCLRQAGRQDLYSSRKDLQADDAGVVLFSEGRLIETSVKDLATGPSLTGPPA